MNDDETRRPDVTVTPVSMTTKRGATDVARGAGGIIENIFLRNKLRIQEEAVIAATQVIEARIRFEEIKALYNDETIGEINKTARDKVTTARLEQELRLAQANLNKSTFDKKARIQNAEMELEALVAEEKLRAFKAGEKPGQAPPQPEKGDTLGEAVTDLNKKMEIYSEALKEVTEFEKRIETDPSLSDAPEWRILNKRLNAAREAMDAAEAKLEELKASKS